VVRADVVWAVTSARSSLMTVAILLNCVAAEYQARMNRSSTLLLAALLVLTGLVACGDDDDTPADAGGADLAAVDSGTQDAAAPSDSGSAADAGADVDAGAAVDAGASVDAGAAVDAGVEVDAGPVDGGSTTLDAGAANACESAGGSCVAVVPRACPGGIVGAADVYSCGRGIGTQCCLPLTTPPMCLGIGGRGEGWYEADGTRICGVGCDGATLSCENVGTRSEGWYAMPASAGCPTPLGGGLVQWVNCSP